ncbi:hypothetical protein PanWU01x14_105400 [Parasponia andersonii]|uniref:Uncharacterized protein n=1 Tax=Parasponia andersonii TaxID=3476 RepID=A0A2P5D1I7_PARAD|nr:hypothetical protein PanWU01x14_105400 [Parasponia andersonii]
MIGVYLFRDPESTDYVLPDEFNRACLINGRVGFGLYPFGEVVGGQQDIPLSSWTSGELSDDVQTPFGKRPRGYVRMKYLCRLTFHWGEPLAFITFFDESGCLCHHV